MASKGRQFMEIDKRRDGVWAEQERLAADNGTTLSGWFHWQDQLNEAAERLDAAGIPHNAALWDILGVNDSEYRQLCRDLATVADLTNRGLEVE